MANIFTFFTVSEVLRFERVLKENQIEVKLMPVPRNLSTSCGTCAKLAKADLDRVLDLVDEKNLEYDEIYEVED